MTTLAPTECRLIRQLAGAERCPVRIVAGDDPPTQAGERAHYTFRDSDTLVHHPGSAMRAGHRLEYHRSTYRVRVGVRWLRVWRARRARVLLLTADCPVGVACDWLDEHGL